MKTKRNLIFSLGLLFLLQSSSVHAKSWLDTAKEYCHEYGEKTISGLVILASAGYWIKQFRQQPPQTEETPKKGKSVSFAEQPEEFKSRLSSKPMPFGILPGAGPSQSFGVVLPEPESDLGERTESFFDCLETQEQRQKLRQQLSRLKISGISRNLQQEEALLIALKAETDFLKKQKIIAKLADLALYRRQLERDSD